MLLLAGFVHGSHLMFGFVQKQAGQDYWLVLLGGAALCLPLLLAYTALAKIYPDYDLAEMLKAVFGKLLGTAAAALYVLFFLMLLAFNLWDISSFYVGSFMQEMPIVVLIAVTAVTCAYAVKKGMGSLAKICLLTVAFGIFIPLLTSAMLIGEMDFSNFLPVMERPAQSYAQPLATIVTVPFGETVALLMAMPAVKDKKKLAGYTVGGAAIACAIFLIVGIRDAAVLGSSAKIYSELAFQSTRMIDIGEFLTRIEIVIALVLTTASFVKISVLYHACVKSVSSMLSLKSHNSLILPIGAIAVALATVVFTSPVYHEDWAQSYSIMFSVPFAVVIPLIALAVSLIRKKKGKSGDIA